MAHLATHQQLQVRLEALEAAVAVLAGTPPADPEPEPAPVPEPAKPKKTTKKA